MKSLIVLLVALPALQPTAGIAQTPVTENAARSYVASAFITGAAPAILSAAVEVGPGLRERLALPPHAGRDEVYRALIGMTEGRTIHVAAGAEELARDGRAPLVVEAGEDLRLLLQYDLRANNIAFVGLPRSATAGGSSAAPETKPVEVARAENAGTQPARLALRPILFEFDRATLSPGAQQMLGNELAQRLRLATAIRVTGHADPLGAPAYNLRLSRERAEAVRERLVALGIDPSRVDVAAAGSAAPAAACSSLADRGARIACLAPERRVELEVELPPL